MQKIKTALFGATGMVGQRLICLLENHPFFEVKVLLAGEKSAHRSYGEAIKGRWKMPCPIPDYVKNIEVRSLQNKSFALGEEVDLVFSAVSLSKEETKKAEEALAKEELIVVSCNSACRNEKDIPMLIPEINLHHLAVLPLQTKRLGTKRGCIVTKPNCSIQSFVPPLTSLRELGIVGVAVSTYQAVSGAGKKLPDMPEMTDNLIPFISGEEQKTEREPLKIWGEVKEDGILPAAAPVISAHCVRVPISDGHTATVSVKFRTKPKMEDILSLWAEQKGITSLSHLPTAPGRLLSYDLSPDRPQPALDRTKDKGLTVSLGRLREDPLFDYKFVCLSHNTLRGAAGGALLCAECLYDLGYFDSV